MKEFIMEIAAEAVEAGVLAIEGIEHMFVAPTTALYNEQGKKLLVQCFGYDAVVDALTVSDDQEYIQLHIELMGNNGDIAHVTLDKATGKLTGVVEKFDQAMVDADDDSLGYREEQLTF